MTEGKREANRRYALALQCNEALLGCLHERRWRCRTWIQVLICVFSCRSRGHDQLAVIWRRTMDTSHYRRPNENGR